MCFGYFPRYFFNETSEQCEAFIYGGCFGNENNFERENDCKARCGKENMPYCLLRNLQLRLVRLIHCSIFRISCPWYSCPFDSHLNLLSSQSFVWNPLSLFSPIGYASCELIYYHFLMINSLQGQLGFMFMFYFVCSYICFVEQAVNFIMHAWGYYWKRKRKMREQGTGKWLKGAKHRMGKEVDSNSSLKVSFCSHFFFFRSLCSLVPLSLF